MKHNEYTIVIQSPIDKDICQWGLNTKKDCNNQGSWAIKILDDRDNVLERYMNLCEAHLIMCVLAWMVQH